MPASAHQRTWRNQLEPGRIATVRMDESLYQAVAEMAKSKEMSMNAFIVRALADLTGRKMPPIGYTNPDRD